MRVFFGVIGAGIGVALGVWFLGTLVADYIAAHMTATSPDDVFTGHALGYLVTVFLSLVGGWFVGWGFGGLFAAPER